MRIKYFDNSLVDRLNDRCGVRRYKHILKITLIEMQCFSVRPHVLKLFVFSKYLFFSGIQERSWLRHYATNHKVASSISDEVIGFFNWRTPSSRSMVLGSTQPLKEKRIRDFPGGQGWPVLRLTIFPPSVSRLSRKCSSLDISKSYGPPYPVSS
jgi:hypothetical protein